MLKPDLHSSLSAHMSGLQPAPGVAPRELDDLRRALLGSLRAGQAPEEIGMVPESQSDPTHVPPADAGSPEPIRLLRRYCEVRDLVFADWAHGQEPARTLGPFVDAVGRRIWFDVFRLQPHLRVFRGGVEVLALPPATVPSPAGSTLAVAPGTVWIPAAQLAGSAPANAWVGVRVTTGSLDCPPGSLFLDGTLSLPPDATITLRIELDSPAVAGPAAGPGAEATSADVHLPDTATFVFGPLGAETVATAPASLSVYGNAVAMERNAAASVYEPAVRMLIIPMAAGVPSITVGAVHSTLFQPTGSADILNGGWGLPVTISQPENLADATGAGSLVVALATGIVASWQGLRGGPATLGTAFLVADPTELKLMAPAAANTRGEHTLELWRESATGTVRSILNAQFPRPFALWFISQRDGLDAVVAESHLSAHLDRPLRVDGRPFPLEIDGSLTVLQRPAGSSVGVEAGQPQGPLLAAALTNALLTLTPPRGFYLNGALESGTKVETGTLSLHSDIYQILPTLPDPYAANFDPHLNRDEPIPGSEFRATISWPDPDHPTLVIALELRRDGVLPQLLPPHPHSRWAIYWMVDVSGGADLLGVSLDFPLDQPELQRLAVRDLTLQAAGDRLHTLLLPQFQWEPVHNAGNPKTGDTEKSLSSSDDGGPSFLRAETVALIPVAPAPLVRELIRAHNEDHATSRAWFTLPFGMQAYAELQSNRYKLPPGLRLLAVPFQDLAGARQISLSAGLNLRDQSLLAGRIFQTENFLAAAPPSNTLGQLRDAFNAMFEEEVPIQRIDLSGYGASIFSRWVAREPDVGITQVSFDAFNGRTSYERILMVSLLWPCLSRMIRTIILERQGSGVILRWDSGWLSTTPGRFIHPKFTAQYPDGVPGIHRGLVEGMYNIREVRDTDQIISVGTADLQAVYYDADIAFARVSPESHDSPVVAGQNSAGRVPARRQLGFIQHIELPVPLPPAALNAHVLTPQEFDQLLERTDPLGGPIDCTLRIGNSPQAMRVTSIETARAGRKTAASPPEFSVAVYGSPVLPAAGRWSVVRVDNAEQTVRPADAQRGVPLIRRDGGPYRWADPEDLFRDAAAEIDYALLMAHDTQRLLVQRPKIDFEAANISTTVQPRVADPYSMLASTGLFPRVDQAIRLPATTELVAGTLTLASNTVNLPAGGLGLPAKPLVDLTSWKSTADLTQAALVIDSLADWKIQLKDVRQKLEYDGLGEIMTMRHDFESVAKDPSKLLEPKLLFGPEIQAVADVLQTLKKLAPALPGGIGPFTLYASFAGTAFRLSATADFKLATGEDNAVECGMGKVKGDLRVGAELSVDIARRDILGAVFLEISGSWQQQVFPLLYAGGHVRFSIRADQSGKTTLELDACTIGSVGGTLVPGLMEVEATVKYGYFIQIKDNKVWPGLVAGMEGRAKLLSGLLGFKFGMEGRVLIYPEIDPGTLDRTNVRLYGRVRVAGTVTVAWLVEERQSFETDFDHRLDWKSILFAAKAGLLPVP